jgi:glycogen operon protein
MTNQDWNEGPPSVGLFLNGEAIPTPGPHGETVIDDSFLLLFNACRKEVEFVLPRSRMGKSWTLELSTADPSAESGSSTYAAHSTLIVGPHSMLILRRVD